MKTGMGWGALAGAWCALVSGCDGGSSGNVEMTDFTVPAGETRRVSGDLTLRALNTIDIQGSLIADPGVSITLEAMGDVSVAGTIRAGDGGPGKPGGALTLRSMGGDVTLGAAATLASGNGGHGVAFIPGTFAGGATATAGARGGDLTLEAPAGALSLTPRDGMLHVGNGGAGADIVLGASDLAALGDAIVAPNAGGDGGAASARAATYVGVTGSTWGVPADIIAADGTVLAHAGDSGEGARFGAALEGSAGGAGGTLYAGVDASGTSTWPAEGDSAKPARSPQGSDPSTIQGAKGGDTQLRQGGAGGKAVARGPDGSKPSGAAPAITVIGGKGGNCRITTIVDDWCKGGKGGDASARGGSGGAGSVTSAKGGAGAFLTTARGGDVGQGLRITTTGDGRSVEADTGLVGDAADKADATGGTGGAGWSSCDSTTAGRAGGDGGTGGDASVSEAQQTFACAGNGGKGGDSRGLRGRGGATGMKAEGGICTTQPMYGVDGDTCPATPGEMDAGSKDAGISLVSVSVSVTPSDGRGGGVVSNPPGVITCPGTCAADLIVGTELVATAKPGWLIGAITFDGNAHGIYEHSATLKPLADATFGFGFAPVGVTVHVVGSGTVTGTFKINCTAAGGTCYEETLSGTTLRVQPPYVSWSGDCSGNLPNIFVDPLKLRHPADCTATILTPEALWALQHLADEFNRVTSNGTSGEAIIQGSRSDAKVRATTDGATLTPTPLPSGQWIALPGGGYMVIAGHDVGYTPSATTAPTATRLPTTAADEGSGRLACDKHDTCVACTSSTSNGEKAYVSAPEQMPPHSSFTAASGAPQSGTLSVKPTDSFVAFTYGGAISTSPDGDVWTPRTSPVAVRLFGAATRGLVVVAVGDNGTIIRSPDDGATWGTVTSGTGQDLTDVADNGTTFVAVGAGGTIVSSADGTSWAPSSVTWTVTPSLHGVTWTGARFIAVGDANTIATSTNGTSWTVQGTQVAPVNLTAIAEGGGKIYVTTAGDLRELGAPTVPIASAPGLTALIHDGARFVGTSGNSVYDFTTSPGTPSVHACGIAGDAIALHDLVLRPAGAQAKLYVAVGAMGQRGAVCTSPDLVTWTRIGSPASPPFVQALDRVVVSTSGTFVATTTSTSGSTDALYSTDGVTWLKAASALLHYPNALVFAGGKFRVLLGAIGQVSTSSDGVAWTAASLTVTPASATAYHTWTDLAHDGTRYIGVGLFGDVFTSTDGVAWTQEDPGAGNTLNRVRALPSGVYAVGANSTITKR